MVELNQKRLGDILLDSGRLTPAQLNLALSRQTQNKKLGEVLQELGILTEQELIETLSEQLGIGSMKADMFLLDPLVVEIVPENFARRHNLIPLFLVENELTVAMSDPLDVPVIDELTRISGYRINYVLASRNAIKNALDEYYSVSHSIEEVIDSFEEDLPKMDSENAPAIRLVNQILFHSIKLGASDVHIEPMEEHCRVRFRIDGILHEIFTPPDSLGDVVTARLKILAKLDISEKRLPQDGRFSITVGDKVVDVRMSSLPTIYGEKLVLRILDKSSMVIGLEQIGLEEAEDKTVDAANLGIDVLGYEDFQKETFLENLHKPYGMFLVTGPTGSGKTTTLYSMIKHLNSPERNIVTVEDPVEYEFNDINQVQVNSKINLTFSRALRSILRQDPDIILIGEIRDEETAAIAVRSALTGHLVLSTLHTNDAVSSIGRMIDMAIAPYLLSSSLVGSIAQRLVRAVCQSCMQLEDADQHLLNQLGLQNQPDIKLPSPRGCAKCNSTGYKGRTAIFEILQVDDTVRSMILSASSSIDIREAATKANLSSLHSAGLKKVLQGITTLDEIERVTITLEVS